MNPVTEKNIIAQAFSHHNQANTIVFSNTS